MPEPFEITVSVDAQARWLEPPKDNIDRIRREYIQQKIQYAAEAAAGALEKLLNGLIRE